MRVRMLKSAAGQELARVTAVGQQSANLGRRQHTSTAVLAATDPNLLNWGSTAVAHTISYSWRPVDVEVGVCGDEHSSGCVLPMAILRSSGGTATSLENSSRATDISMRTRITPAPWCPLHVDGCSSDQALTKNS